MISRNTYPAKRILKPGGDFTVRHYVLPIRVRGSLLWAWLDTGANISILPKNIADDIGIYGRGQESGTYHLAGLVGVPYHTKHLDVEILEYIPGTIPELDLSSYSPTSPSAVSLHDVQFQLPVMRWSEIAQKLEAHESIDIKEEDMPWAILGLHGVLDQLNLSLVGKNAVTLSPKQQK